MHHYNNHFKPHQQCAFSWIAKAVGQALRRKYLRITERHYLPSMWWIRFLLHATHLSWQCELDSVCVFTRTTSGMRSHTDIVNESRRSDRHRVKTFLLRLSLWEEKLQDSLSGKKYSQTIKGVSLNQPMWNVSVSFICQTYEIRNTVSLPKPAQILNLTFIQTTSTFCALQAS